MKNPDQVRKNSKVAAASAQPRRADDKRVRVRMSAAEFPHTRTAYEEKLAIKQAAELLGLTTRQFISSARKRALTDHGSLLKKAMAVLPHLDLRELKVFDDLLTAFCDGSALRREVQK
jgi:hypothetical protein